MSRFLAMFARKSGSGISYSIRFWGLSSYSHVVVVDPIFRLAIHASGPQNMVVIESLDQVINYYNGEVEFAWLPGHLSLAYKRVGRPYDRRPFFWHLFKRPLRLFNIHYLDNPQADNCTELVGWTSQTFRPWALSTLTIRDVRMISRPLSKRELTTYNLK